MPDIFILTSINIVMCIIFEGIGVGGCYMRGRAGTHTIHPYNLYEDLLEFVEEFIECARVLLIQRARTIYVDKYCCVLKRQETKDY